MLVIFMEIRFGSAKIIKRKKNPEMKTISGV